MWCLCTWMTCFTTSGMSTHTSPPYKARFIHLPRQWASESSGPNPACIHSAKMHRPTKCDSGAPSDLEGGHRPLSWGSPLPLPSWYVWGKPERSLLRPEISREVLEAPTFKYDQENSPVQNYNFTKARLLLSEHSRTFFRDLETLLGQLILSGEITPLHCTEEAAAISGQRRAQIPSPAPTSICPTLVLPHYPW